MEASERNRLERLLAVLSLGLCVALRERFIELDEAERLLFSPGTMRSLANAGAARELITLIHSGTELENILSLLPDRFTAALDEMNHEAQVVLTSTSPSDSQLNNWLEQVIPQR